ncbi:MAG: hypothetical protein RR626_08780 [Anaerovoracaceae bacterium]
MKTIIITLSPRKSFSTSAYFSKVLAFFMAKGEVSILEVKTLKQYLALEAQLDQIDNLVCVTPVYVDTIPSTVLDILEKIERAVSGKSLSLNVYALTNCGFYEGEQCALALNTFNLWCKRCGFTFRGGLGIGAGVMVGFIRTLIPIGIAITLIELLVRAATSLIEPFFPWGLVIQTVLYLLWSMGMFVHTFKMAKKVEKGETMGCSYTQIWFCPRFLFVPIASLYWLLASMIWYRGAFWRLHKAPKK